MRFLGLVVVGLVVVACGSSADVGGSASNDGAKEKTNGTESPDGSAKASAEAPPEPAPRCSTARHVASANELEALAKELPWQELSLGRTGTLSLSDDIVADGDLEIDASTIASPPTCSTNDASARWCHEPLFREYAFPRWTGEGRIAGVTCPVAGDRPVREGETCARLAIAKGTSFRLRAGIEDMHPSAPTYWPFVEIERACLSPCDAGETRCEASQTCFARGFETCAYCAAKSSETCACAGADGPEVDGTTCSFGTSPDTIASGTCKAGVCKR